MLRLAPLAAFACLVAPTVWAQSDPYRPLSTGNEWTYYVQAYDGPQDSGTGTCLPAYDQFRYVRARVAGPADGDSSALAVTCDVFGSDGATLLQRDTIAVPSASVPPPGLDRRDPFACANTFAPAPRGGQPGSLTIGDQTYTFEAVAEHDYFGPFGPEGPTEDYFDREWRRWASGVGLINWDYSRDLFFPDTGGPCLRYERSLVYAVIGGEEYGTRTVGLSSSSSPSAAPLVLSLFPSPASSSLTVTSGITGRLELLDLLGRRVAQAEAVAGQPLQLDVSAWPAGLYIARTADGDEVRTARFVVAR